MTNKCMKWKADTNAENMGVEEVRPRRPHFVVTGENTGTGDR